MVFKVSDDQQQLIIEEASSLEYNQLKSHLTRQIANWRFDPRVKRKIWDGRISHFNNGKIAIGLWKECKDCCDKYGYPFVISNKDHFPIDKSVTIDTLTEFCKEFFIDHTFRGEPFFPHDHQIEEAAKVLKYRYCLTEVATSGGKTLILSLIMFYILKKINPDAKFLVIVPSIQLVTQTYNEIHSYNLGYNNENKNPLPIRIDEIMSQTPRKIVGEQPNISIGTFQSLDKWPEEWFKQFYCVVIDESHKGSSNTIQKIVKMCNTAHYRIGMSGTFFKPDSLEQLTIQSITGPKMGTIKAKSLMEKGIVTPVNIRAIVLNHNDAEFYDITKTLRKSGEGKKSYELECQYIHASQARADFIISLLKKATKNVLLLFGSLEYGTMLYERARNEIIDKHFYYIDGSISKDKREYIKGQMELEDDIVKVALCSFQTTSTGVSIRNLHSLILADSTKSPVTIRQSIGRMLRLHHTKDTALILDLVDVFEDIEKSKSHNILYQHYTERKIIYDEQSFPNTMMKVNLKPS